MPAVPWALVLISLTGLAAALFYILTASKATAGYAMRLTSHPASDLLAA